ncbi:MAG: phosphate ABC transporter permease subunit PstC [Candidatus Hydrogenedentes bacterium]|nr:phosphate ABC transporter permease subunit PstC [Candidatus Hydrogenedentota bacterium]
MKQDKAIAFALMLIALSAVSGLALITVFIFKEGLPLILKSGAGGFFFSTDWDPKAKQFGIFSMIVGSLVVTAGAMIIGTVFGLGLAIVLTIFCPKALAAILKPLIELLAGIPSVVYGFIGVVTIVPFIRDYFGGPGLSVLATSIVLGVMVLPTVTSISIDALKSVPRSYWEGSIALGATEWQSTHMVMLKAARSGIVAAIILGMGRAVGETMAVIMVCGNTLEIPSTPLDPLRTLTSNIALEMGYATGEHREALFATAVTLFVIIMILNIAALTIARRGIMSNNR